MSAVESSDSSESGSISYVHKKHNVFFSMEIQSELDKNLTQTQLAQMREQIKAKREILVEKVAVADPKSKETIK